MPRRRASMCAVTFVAAAMALAPLAHSADQPSYREQVSALRQEFGQASKSKDYASMERLLHKMDDLVHGRADTAYKLACTYALAGKNDQAFEWLARFAAMGAVADASTDPDLASIVTDSRFKEIQERLHQNGKPVSNSTAFASFAEVTLLPEDITYDPRGRAFLVSSVLTRKILRVDSLGRTSVFADLGKDPGWPVFAVHFDAKHHIVWATASAIPDFTGVQPADFGKSVLLKLDARSGKIIQRIFLHDSAPRSLGDMDIAANGDLIVTDGLGSAVYRLVHGRTTLERLDHGQFGSPQTPAITPDGRYAYIADYSRGIARMEISTGAVTWLKHADDVALAGTDGLVLDGSKLFAIQNGANPVRIVRLLLNEEGDAVERLDVMEANYPELGDPTHAVIVDGKFYFLANSGWSALDDHGRPKPGARLTPPTIRQLPLR